MNTLNYFFLREKTAATLWFAERHGFVPLTLSLQLQENDTKEVHEVTLSSGRGHLDSYVIVLVNGSLKIVHMWSKAKSRTTCNKEKKNYSRYIKK